MAQPLRSWPWGAATLSTRRYPRLGSCSSAADCSLILRPATPSFCRLVSCASCASWSGVASVALWDSSREVRRVSCATAARPVAYRLLQLSRLRLLRQLRAARLLPSTAVQPASSLVSPVRALSGCRCSSVTCSQAVMRRTFRPLRRVSCCRPAAAAVPTRSSHVRRARDASACSAAGLPIAAAQEVAVISSQRATACLQLTRSAR
jgi:hypothetical protein